MHSRKYIAYLLCVATCIELCTSCYQIVSGVLLGLFQHDADKLINTAPQGIHVVATF
jgi:hypothetical protein